MSEADTILPNESTSPFATGKLCVGEREPVTINDLTRLVWAHDCCGRIAGIDTQSDLFAYNLRVKQGSATELCMALNALPVLVAIAQETVETLRDLAADKTDDASLLADRFERLLTEAGVKL